MSTRSTTRICTKDVKRIQDKDLTHIFYERKLSETALFQYKCDNLYAQQSEGSIIWNNPDIDIEWDIPLGYDTTYAWDLAIAIVAIINDYKTESLNSQLSPLNNSKTGIYHYSNEGVCSWFDFTKMIAEYSGQANCDIQPCYCNEFPSPVTRPSYSVLDKTKIKETFGITVPYWTESLRKCIGNLRDKITFSLMIE